MFAVFALLLEASTLVSLTVTAAALAGLAWPPLRAHGHEVTLHASGLVLTRKAGRSAILFEDVNEVWFEIPRLHSSRGAYLRALRLVGFDGKTHRVPLTVDGGATLANAILRQCSTPLLADARKALDAGETLTFGPVQLTASGITVNGADAAWSEIRLARLEAARVALLRRLPFLTWRTVRLDQIPNPTIFCALILRCVKDVSRDDHLLVELDSGGGRDAASVRTPARARQDLALRNTLVGGVTLLVGLGITWASHCASRSYDVIAIGPIAFGALRLIQGVIAFGSKRSR